MRGGGERGSGEGLGGSWQINDRYDLLFSIGVVFVYHVFICAIILRYY